MSASVTIVETPLMKQYLAIKAKYPDALLLFRVGDFYETFGEDAIKTAGILGIVLTRRANGAASYVELAGFPYHSLDSYLPKLVRAGHRVAICDQLEDPKLTKKIVKRGVTELITPGVSFSDKILDHKTNNFLASVHYEKDIAGVSFVDVSTGEFLAAQGSIAYIDKLLQSLRPTEVIFKKGNQKRFAELHGDKFYTYKLDEWIYQTDFATEKLLQQLGTTSLKGFGIDEMNLAIIAAGATIHYLSETRQENLKHLSSISRLDEEKYVWLDKFTMRNLELVNTVNESAKTLYDILDHTITPMGARLLKRWIVLPLKEIEPINERHDIVHFILHQNEFKKELFKLIKQVGDLERLISRAAILRISPREVRQLGRSLQAIAPLKKLCAETGNIYLSKISDQLNPCSILCEKIDKELKPDPPAVAQKGGIIAEGVNKELDELRSISFSGKDYLLTIQQREVERTGITSLKVAFNNVFGYYIEVTNTHKSKVPPEWTRKQTLVNCERYITEELKSYEEKILGAEEKILAIELMLFEQFVKDIGDYIQAVQLNAGLLARLDCLLSLAEVAETNSYVRPGVNDSAIIDIKNGRHPVIETLLPVGESYITNDIYLDNDSQQIIMITGPNMSGKSALLRQTALIVLMAQIGSFVPASSAEIGLVDKIFTRVGASDNISLGESTFMVEMNETASILNNLSSRSLVLLDEIGRGTSTYDGISIAWAIAEYIHDQPVNRAKTLFATHYHELNEMAETLPRIRNYNVSVKEVNNKILFVRKLVPGGSEHSFGIHVAQMAGMPVKILQRSKEILSQLEKSHSHLDHTTKPDKDLQLSIFQLDDPMLEQIREEILKTDIDTLTPVEALMKLSEIRKMLRGK